MKGKVIIIEDDKKWQRKLSQYLIEAGFYVEVSAELKSGLEKIENEIFHFATVDLQLDNNTQNPSEFEGWDILEEIIRHRTDNRMPTMVITGFPEQYKKFSKTKNLKATFFMSKKEFDKKEFIENVINAVEEINIRSFDDKRE